MHPYSVNLPDGNTATVIQKTEGRKRSPRILFFKMRQNRTLIAYSVKTNGQNAVEYKIYKTRGEGEWLKGGERHDGKFTGKDADLAFVIGKAIDQYESGLGKDGWKWLF